MPRPSSTRKPTRKKQTAKRLKSHTGRAEPAGNEGRYGLPTNRVAGVRVTEDTALTLGAVYACIRVITEDIAGLPWHVHEKLPAGGSVEVPTDPVDWLLHTQASLDTPAFQFRETIIAHALTWGNGYAEIERDMAGRPLWLWLLTPDRVTVYRDGQTLVYEVKNPQGSPTYIPADDMFHLRGLGFDGLVGYSVIQLAARSIGAGIAMDQSAADLFANDSTPGGMLKHPGRLSNQARDRLKSDWEKRHMGPTNRRRVAILEEGMDWMQTGLPPEDSKLIESRQFTPSDICRWFRVKPHKIADLSRATFSNIESENTSHYIDTLLPWARRLETEANIKLFGRTNRGRRFTRVNFNAFLRGDAAARSTFYTSMLDRGVFCINDVLSLEDRNPIGSDGDKRFVPLNMQLLDKAGEEPPTGATPTPVDEEIPGGDDETPPEEEDDDSDNEAMMSALRPVFEDAAHRVLRREAQIAEPHLKTGAANVVAWFEKAREGHEKFIRQTISPAVAALALVCSVGWEDIDAALGSVIEKQVVSLQSRLTDAIADPEVRFEWELLAPPTAAMMIDHLKAAVKELR